MGKIIGITMIAVLLLTACSTAYMAYRDDMFAGENRLHRGDYEEARTLFVRALENQKDARALAFAATASYKLNDLTAAGGYLAEAEKLKNTGFSYLRIIGYKTLTLLRQNKKTEGMEALKEYIEAYSRVYPLPTIDRVERMWKRDQVDLAALEKLIDEQVNTYESDIALYTESGVGWYQRFYPGYW